MNWIQLNTIDDRLIWVNMDQVACVVRHRGHTILAGADGNEDSYMAVKESVDEVMQKLGVLL